MQTILILNTKGGSGKTTIATNIAGYFASNGIRSALMDFDPQGSSQNWLEARPDNRPYICNVAAGMSRSGVTRSWQLRLDQGIERVIIDAPAGASGLILQDMIHRTDMIIVPVGPSSIDIHATAHFIQNLLCIGRIRAHGIQVGVVANRVRHNSIYDPLQRFLNSLKIPLVTILNDSDIYIEAAAAGIGIHEMEPSESVRRELEQWKPLMTWLDDPAGFLATHKPMASPHLIVANK